MAARFNLAAINRTHGASGTPTYTSWTAMRSRCRSVTNDAYTRYGGRGIAVCERWRNSFENFLADMGERPPGTSLDRWPNKNGNYEPGNCRWATPIEQSRNQVTNRLLTFQGESLPISEWAQRAGVKRQTFRNRIDRGWSMERALSTGAQTP